MYELGSTWEEIGIEGGPQRLDGDRLQVGGRRLTRHLLEHLQQLLHRASPLAPSVLRPRYKTAQCGGDSLDCLLLLGCRVCGELGCV